MRLKMVQTSEITKYFGFPGARPWHDSTELTGTSSAEITGTSSTELTGTRQGEHWEFKIQSDF